MNVTGFCFPSKNIAEAASIAQFNAKEPSPFLTKVGKSEGVWYCCVTKKLEVNKT